MKWSFRSDVSHRMRSQRAPVAMAAGIAALTLVGALALGADAAPSNNYTSPFPPIDDPAPVTYRDTGLISSPAPVGTDPGVSQDTALALVSEQGFPESMVAGAALSSLRLVTYAPSGLTEEELAAAGAYYDRLSWVIEYPESSVDLHGPPDLSDEARSTIAQADCSMLFTVDATLGRVDQAFQLCEPAATD